MKEVHTLLARCGARGWTVATAESCTGGMVGMHITAVAGASACYAGGVICYSNASKTALLDVPEQLLARKGAVSEEVAAAMANGARQRLGADAAVAVTGIAGPGGGSAAKPVGTVFIATATASGVRGEHHRWTGGRARVRTAACRAALRALAEALALHENLEERAEIG